jgi:hypothetical protein
MRDVQLDLFNINTLEKTTMLDHSCQAGAHPHADRAHDLYATPPSAVEALLRVEKIPWRTWEPAAGRGGIARVLRAHAIEVVASDIALYDFELDFTGDFLTQDRAPPGVEALVTNPPYKLCGRSAPFVAHALDLVPHVFLLMRLSFLESASRSEILERRGLRTVHVFRNRLPMMHRDGWIENKATNAMPFCWMVWSRDYTGPTTLGRI